VKVFFVFWLLCAGIGVSYSVILERKKQIEILHEMEGDLKKLAYYMCEWRMPIEEAIGKMIKEKGRFQNFYETIHKKISERFTEDFDKLWQEESEKFFTNVKTRAARELWEEVFWQMPMESEGFNRYLNAKSTKILEIRKNLEEKYRGEQRLVFSMGFFVSAFLCLILW
jgi:hypothetical protein